MSYTIAQVRTAVLSLLDDVSSARYTSAQIDTAVRSALIDYGQYRPLVQTYIFETDGNQRMSLPADFSALSISSIELWDADPAQGDEIKFKAWKEDEQWIIETDEVLTAHNVLSITYNAPHTVDGLDSAAGTSVDDSPLLAVGAAGYAARSRAVSRSESINLQPQVMAQLLKMSDTFLTNFTAQLRTFAPAHSAQAMQWPNVRF